MVKVMKKGFASVHRKAKRKGIEGKRKIFMYRKDSEKWLKHLDFIALDMICLQLAVMFAYAIRGYGMNVYGDILYIYRFYLVLLRMGFTCATAVTSNAVVSYTAFPPLP